MAKMFEGRTILISKNQDVNETTTFDNQVTLNKNTHGNIFVEFDSISNAKVEYDKLVAQNIKCKYSNYYLFVRFSLDKNKNKNDLVSKISENLTNKFSNLNILDINLYEKNNNMLGFGQVVLDRLEDIKSVLSDNTIEVDDDNIVSFYKYNRSR
tara:strand:+ start:15003 stop:15464 length:462 start_codon:yes stop_codon:yes gene_type:complete